MVLPRQLGQRRERKVEGAVIRKGDSAIEVALGPKWLRKPMPK